MRQPNGSQTITGDDSHTEAFEKLAAALEYPMYVVSTEAGGVRAGCLVGFITQCSIDPPRLLVCISKNNHTFRIASRAEVLTVNFLGLEDRETAKLFGEETSDDTDKFARCNWVPGPGGAPVLESGRGWVAGRIVERFDVGDHGAFLVDPFSGEARSEGPQLGFQDVQDLEPGHPA